MRPIGVFGRTPMLSSTPKNTKNNTQKRAPLSKEFVAQLVADRLGYGPKPQKHPTAMINGLKRALSIASDLIPGVSEVKSAIGVGREAFSLARDIRDEFSGSKRESKSVEPSLGKTVSAGSVAVPSRSVSYATGTIGNAVASRSGMGTPVAFRNWNHPVFGPALRLRGTQIFSMVTKEPALSTAALASATNKALQPKSMAYLISLVSDVFQSYRFNYIRLRYVPGCPTTTPGQVRFAYMADPNTTTFDTMNFATTAQSPYQMTCAAWEPASMTISPVPCAYDKLYQYDIGATGPVAAARTTMQGRIYGFWSGAEELASAVTTGTLEIDYEVDLFDSGPSLAGLPSLVGPLREMRFAYLRGDSDEGDVLRTLVHSQVDNLAKTVSQAALERRRGSFSDESLLGDPVASAVAAASPAGSQRGAVSTVSGKLH